MYGSMARASIIVMLVKAVVYLIAMKGIAILPPEGAFSGRLKTNDKSEPGRNGFGRSQVYS